MDNASYELEEIHGFASLAEYERFLAWLNALVDGGDIEETSVESRYGSTAFVERWYREQDGSTWRLVEPDAPFRGAFERVSEPTTVADIRARWSRLRARLDAQAVASKNSQAAVVELSERYRLLAPSERPIVDRLLGQWALANDESLRFDALALISDHAIVSALPQLDELATRLDSDPSPGAPYEKERVMRIVERLRQEAPDASSD